MRNVELAVMVENMRKIQRHGSLADNLNDLLRIYPH